MRAAWRKASVLRGLAVGSVCSEKAAFQPERAVGILQGRPRVGRRDSCPRGTSELSAGTPLFGKGCSAGLKSSPSQRVGFVLGSGLRGGNVVPLRAADKEVRTERCPLGVAGGAQWQGATTGDSVCTPKAGYDCARDARAHRDTVDFGVGCGAARAAGIEVAEACLASLGATGPARAKVTDLSRPQVLLTRCRNKASSFLATPHQSLPCLTTMPDAYWSHTVKHDPMRGDSSADDSALSSSLAGP